MLSGTDDDSESSRNGRRLQPVTASYGTWKSPIAAQTVAAGALRLGGVSLDGKDLYWIEGRPEEGGRNVLVKRSVDGRIADVTPAGANVRTRVHEYGGAAYVVSRGTIYYSEFVDQRLCRLEPGGLPEPLTPPGDWFYADGCINPSHTRLVCVREDHTKNGHEPVTTLVSVPLHGPPTAGQVIVSGHDFYSTPRFSPDGSRLSWLAWRHPRMPWDGTELWVANVARDGTLEEPQRITRGDTDAIFQPGWSPDGTLYFVSDRTGWWNLYRVGNDRVELVHAMAADFGRPQWQFGMSTWVFADPSRLVVTYQQLGRWRLATIDLRTGTFTPERTELEPGENIIATHTHAMFVGGSAAAPDAVVCVHLETGTAETFRAASDVALDEDCLSVPEPIEFPTRGDLTAHAFFYAPRNRNFTAPPGERPPLIVISHGGPTASASARLNLEVQYWTSRGFAVVDVNYGGSSGYGRTYRRRLNGQWGVVDVTDCVNAAKYLIAHGHADPDRLVIRGRSAGGYTTLAALTFHPDVFKAGASYYGISDLEAMGRETHKFESRYLDTLIGPYPAKRDIYRARSPIHVVDRLACPLILFQGLEDRVVPPNQSRMITDAVRAKGVPVALLTFEGEQHGFRKGDTIVRCLEAELYFYGAVFGFVPADRLSPILIDNIDRDKPKFDAVR
ncbi:MAG: dipeptidyl-peptidase 5 [Gemmatimonadota bacterium]